MSNIHTHGGVKENGKSKRSRKAVCSLSIYNIQPRKLAQLNKLGIYTVSDVIKAINKIYKTDDNTDANIKALKVALGLSERNRRDPLLSNELRAEILRKIDTDIGDDSIWLTNILFRHLNLNIPELLNNNKIYKSGICERCRVLIGQLPNNQCEIIVLRNYYGLVEKQISDLLNTPYRQVEIEMARALRALKSPRSIDMLLYSDMGILKSNNIHPIVLNDVSITELGLTPTTEEELRSLGIISVGKFMEIMGKDGEVGKILRKRHIDQKATQELLSVYNISLNKYKTHLLDAYDLSLQKVDRTIESWGRVMNGE